MRVVWEWLWDMVSAVGEEALKGRCHVRSDTLA